MHSIIETDMQEAKLGVSRVGENDDLSCCHALEHSPTK